MGKILIKNGKIWDGERFFYADVLTNAEAVERIEPKIEETADFVYDAKGKTVTAGLVDVHTHLQVHPTDQFGTPADISCFPFGVTAAADAGRSVGDPSILASFVLKNVVFVNAHFKNNHANFQKTEKALETFGDRVVGIKTYFDTTQSDVSSIGPLSEVCEFAAQRGLRVMVHCSNSPVPMAEILGTLRPGDILTHSFHGGSNNASEDNYESMKAAQRRGVIIDVGFAGHVHTDFAVLKGALDRGIVPDIIGSDITRFSAFTRGGRYGMTMCMSIAKSLGMKEDDIFRAVTSNPAASLGKGNEWGKLAARKCADISVLDYTDEGFCLTDKAGNTVHSDQGYRCVLTVADGRVVFKY